MKKENQLAPMSAQERKEDIEMLMNSEMMDATVGGGCSSCNGGCLSTCLSGCSPSNQTTTGPGTSS
jgi:hypothetical protein